MLENKEKFIKLLQENVNRNGIEKLIEWIEKTDFFEAPASTKFHSAYKGGLCEHSLNVYETYIEKHFEDEVDNLESVTIVTLLHDLCKANFYAVSKRNQKIDGKWEEVEFYSVDDVFPYGHGEKSAFLIERFMRLKIDEATAIRWHMGGFDDSVKAGSFTMSTAYEKYPMAVKTHLSDLDATYLKER